MSKKPSKEDWDATLGALEIGLAAAGIPAPLRATRRVVSMVKQHRTAEGKLAPDYEREKAIQIVEEAVGPLAHVHLNHMDDLEELKKGQDQILDLVVRLLLLLQRNPALARDEPMRVLFEGPKRAPAPSVPFFTGRTGELEQLEHLLLSDARITCVVATGIGGIGKTTLAQEFVATRAPDIFPEGTAWLDGGQLDSELGRVARRFGWVEERAPTPTEANSLLGRVLHSKPFLLVVDNFNPEVGDPTLVPSPGGQCRTLVTSRARALPGRLQAAKLELGVWTPEACREYLEERCPKLVEEVKVDALVDFVGRLPLGVRLLVSVFDNRQSLDAAAFLSLLEAHPLGVLDKYEADRGIAATFQVSYDALSEEERRVLQAIAVCAKQTRAEVVSAVAGVSDASEILDGLHQRGLAEFAAEAKAPWGLHDVVRMFVLEQPCSQDFAAAHTTWVEQYLDSHATAAAYREFSASVNEALATVERCTKHPESLSNIIRLLSLHFRQVGRFHELIQLGEFILRFTGRDSMLAANVLLFVGDSYRLLGDLNKAILYQEQALAIYESRGHDGNCATALGNLGVCMMDINISKAAALHTRALTIDRELGNLGGEAKHLANLGACHMMLGHHPVAIDYYISALRIDEQRRDLGGMADRLVNLGACYEALGDLTKASSFLRRALELQVRFARPDAQAVTLANLGNCAKRAGDSQVAVDYYERSLVIDEDLGNVKGQASNLANLGFIAAEHGDHEQARAHLIRAHTILQRMRLPKDHPHMKTVVNALADLPAD